MIKEGMHYVLDIDDLRMVLNEIGSNTSNPDEQFERINDNLEKNYRVKLPKGLKNASIEKFGDMVTSPLILERSINTIIKRKVIEGTRKITIKNPSALYRIGILGFDNTIELDINVEGDVGNFFGAFCNFNGTWKVTGNAENGLADKGYKGKIIVDGFATELACQNDQSTNFSNGVDVLVNKGCMERAMGQARGGNLVTFGAGYNSGLYMSGGILLNLGAPGELFGPGMVGGVIYSQQGTTVAEGAKIESLDIKDYQIIKETLKIFENELFVQHLDRLSIENPLLELTRDKNSIIECNFHDMIKIIPDTQNNN